MFGLSKITQRFYSPDDNEGIGGGGDLNRDKILDILEAPDDDDVLDLKDNKDDKADKSNKDGEGDKNKSDKGTKKEAKSNKEDKSNKGDESDEDDEGEEVELDDELKDLEDEMKEVKEEDLELITPVRRREILKEYPELFKKFPYLEQAYYREQKYTEIFPTLDEARAAQENVNILKEFEQKILTGDISSILKTVKEDEPESYTKLVDNYLDTLMKVDRDAHLHVVTGVAKQIIYQMAVNARDNEDDDLKAAAAAVNKFLFGTTKWEAQKPLSKQETTESKESAKIKQEREEAFQERFQTSVGDVTTQMESSLKRTIGKYIDEKQHMTDYVRRQAEREAYEQLMDNLGKDTRYRSVLDRAWKRAGEANFSKASLDQVKAVISARAKTILPQVIRKARIDALKGMGKRVRENNDSDTDNKNNGSGRSASSTNRGPLKQRESNNTRGQQDNNNNKIPKGVSNRDFIMND